MFGAVSCGCGGGLESVGSTEFRRVEVQYLSTSQRTRYGQRVAGIDPGAADYLFGIVINDYNY